jgi:hypothetical protein
VLPVITVLLARHSPQNFPAQRENIVIVPLCLAVNSAQLVHHGVVVVLHQSQVILSLALLVISVLRVRG